MSDSIQLHSATIYSRAERIAAALFLVSNIMSDTEVLKTRIRNIALDIVSSGISLKDNIEIDNHRLLRSLEKKVLELISFLNITAVSGLISEMNANILKREMESFLKSISDMISCLEAKEPKVSDKFFDDPTLSQEGIKDTNNHVLLAATKDKIGRKNQRNKDILSLIAKKGDVSIKDIASAIKGCSEKTVQRELNLLIENGLIKKTGERRWSRYSLV